MNYWTDIFNAEVILAAIYLFYIAYYQWRQRGELKVKPEHFKKWRLEMGYTQSQAADALGLSKATIENYDKGTRREDGREVKIPLTIALACNALLHGLKPYDEH